MSTEQKYSQVSSLERNLGDYLNDFKQKAHKLPTHRFAVGYEQNLEDARKRHKDSLQVLKDIKAYVDKNQALNPELQQLVPQVLEAVKQDAKEWYKISTSSHNQEEYFYPNGRDDSRLPSFMVTALVSIGGGVASRSNI